MKSFIFFVVGFICPIIGAIITFTCSDDGDIAAPSFIGAIIGFLFWFNVFA